MMPGRHTETPERDIESGAATPVGSQSRMNGAGAGGKKQWYKKIGWGIWKDIKARAPYYGSDWTDAWNYRVVPATWVCGS